MKDWKEILSAIGESLPVGGTDPADNAEANEPESGPDRSGRPVLTIFYEKKGRAGKPATIITGFDPESDGSLREADELASLLKKRLGCGGASRGGEILLQGDRRSELRRMLPTLGYRHIKG